MSNTRDSASRRVAARARRVGGLLPASTRPAAGQGLVEYGLILTLIAIVTIVALIFLGGQLAAILSIIGSSIDGAS